MITLESPLTAVLGATTPAKRKKFESGLGLRTVGDLLRHFPRRYLETGSLSRVHDLRIGQLLCVVGEIDSCTTHTYRDRRSGRNAYRVEAVLRTDGARLTMTFFAKNPGTAQWHAARVAEGNRGVFLGKADRFRDQWQLVNPQMTIFGMADQGEDDAAGSAAADDRVSEVLDFGNLFPIYPLTKGVESWDVARAVKFALGVVEELPEIIPAAVREEYDVLEVARAYDWVHRPEHRDQVEQALHRFRFEEALITQLVLGRRRRARRGEGAVARTGGGGLLAAFDERLPFTLTDGQRRVGEQIEADLAQEHPMNRLLQGEVGSGKTLVALRAMLRVVDSGGQAALLAPTEVLAQQHYRSMSAMLGDLAAGGLLGALAGGESTCVELLTGSMTKSQRTGPLSRVASGEAGIVVGTHALLQDQVMFADLGMVVVDEQHRFGVEQRAALTEKASAPPHLLVMTATPIPRTVAMTVFGDLETSTLSELPAGRAPIQSNVVPLADHPAWFGRVWARVREEVEKGHQVYVVCPRISGDDAEASQVESVEVDENGDEVVRPAAASVEEVLDRLTAGPLSGLRLAGLHGKLPAEEKDATMRRFAAGEVDVLVSTTVIEVGVDVHNATAIVILDADRFGVSQLHQLRGRVGRGGLPGLCLLVTGAEQGSDARERLDAVAATTDGFVLSRIDLEQRREGDVLGASQAGRRSSLENLRVLRDEDTIVAARRAAEDLLEADPGLTAAPGLAAEVRDLEVSAQADFAEMS
ncbi:ATP-dependent DNA helicase RecG [Nocardioides sp. GY 10113]|uniref:ATP-dependent DNA helicase RecG n=1 Tax=Nocardioides sp. GY 10113 TaxID=2569761 RepID=UPI0010A826A3|nr:ATP-dependent DNA helicase RecG [Nocardioides sp. GY 10113]TIC88117.1 ATP-dependent DNA helicase RecG [Nocardioides sp. GY 10113]